MKTASDPRHKKREALIKKLYELSFNQNKTIPSSLKLIVENLATIDKIIADCAPEWPIEKLNKIDLAVLRLAVFELMLEKKNPPKVIIDEASELGKEYGSQNSAKFINGVLGSVLKKLDGKNKR